MIYGKLEVYKMKKNMKYKIVTLLKQRRIWATILSAIAVISLSLGQQEITGICTAIAGVLGLHSYIQPKK